MILGTVMLTIVFDLAYYHYSNEREVRSIVNWAQFARDTDSASAFCPRLPNCPNLVQKASQH